MRAAESDSARRGESGSTTLLKAVLVNLLNHNPYLGWMLVIGPLLMKGCRDTPACGIAVLVGFYGTIVFGGTAIVVLFSTAKSLGRGVNRLLPGLSAAGLVLFGFYQLWQGIGALGFSH